jgi:hypothetical protein
MKSILLSLCLIFTALSVSASTVDQRQFSFNGPRSLEQFDLAADLTRTEYRIERIAKTCYREVLDYYRTDCYSRPVQRCTYRQPVCRDVRGPDGRIRRVCSGGGNYCQTVYVRECRQVPVYRSEPYTCYEQVRIPYEVFERKVEAKVSVVLNDAPANQTAQENFTVELKGNLLTLSVNGSGNFLITKLENISGSIENGVEKINAQYEVNFFDMQPLRDLFTTGINGLEISRTQISGKLPYDLDSNLVGVHVDLVRKKFLAKNPVILRRVLNPNEYSIGAGDLNINLPGTLDKGRYLLKLKLFLKGDQAILNSQQLNQTSLSLEKKFKINKMGEAEVAD